jgi:hypothetical protein
MTLSSRPSKPQQRGFLHLEPLVLICSSPCVFFFPRGNLTDTSDHYALADVYTGYASLGRIVRPFFLTQLV